MNNFRILTSMICLIFLSGCISLNPFNKSKTPKINQPKASVNKAERIGTIVDKELFAKGGEIVVFPFSAGQGIVANEELDKISLMIIKGITDVFEEHNNNKFKLAFSSEADDAGILVQGHIVSKIRSMGFKKWFFMNRRINLGFKAKMVDKATGNLIVVFEGNRSLKKADFNVLAFTVGQEIGAFLAKEEN